MKEALILFIKQAFLKLGYEDFLNLTISQKSDYQINSVFEISKRFSKKPQDVGEELIDAIKDLNGYENYIKDIEFVLPGFINITVSDKLINTYINDYINNGFIKQTNKNDIFFLDYGGPNIAKPLHIGHLRPAIIGESVKRILNAKGYTTISDVHLGDYGLQIGEVIYAIINDKKTIDDIDIDYLNEAYPRMSAICKENKEIHDICQGIVYDLQNGKEEYQAYFKKIKEVSVSDIKRIYKYLDVDFDLWLGESDSKEYIAKLIDALEEKKLLRLDDGAKIVDVKEETDNKEMPPVIIVNSQGASMYATTDIATIMQRNDIYKPNHILYFTDARQSLHFEGVFRVCKKLGIDIDLVHNTFGTINDKDGKPFKTRSGEALKLDELIKMTKEEFLSKREENKDMPEDDLDKQVNAIIKYADLQNNREKSYNFDLSKFSEVSGKTGPYVLYTAIRIRKILENNSIYKKSVTNRIYNEIDRNLRMEILNINNAIDRSLENYMPSIIADYLYDLCNEVNSFYQNVNVSKLENEEEKNDYLNVLKLTYDIIVKCLDMLLIKVPTRM